MVNPMKNLETKYILQLLQRISLALPIIIGVLWIILSAALASDHRDDGSYCTPGEAPFLEEPTPRQEHAVTAGMGSSPPDLSPKLLYWGQYHDLDLMEKIKIKTAPAVNPDAFDRVAIAFAFPLEQLANVVEENNCWSMAYDLITRGRLALAVQIDHKINILPSDDIFRAWVEALDEDDLRAVYEIYETVPRFLSAEYRQTADYEAWLSDWADLIPSDARSSLATIHGIETFRPPSHTLISSVFGAYTDDIIHLDDVDVLAISPEKNLFGIESKDRLITWDGVHTFPALALPSP